MAYMPFWQQNGNFICRVSPYHPQTLTLVQRFGETDCFSVDG
jgi:hypothetical protein